MIEFKVFDNWDEKTLEDFVARAHAQIEQWDYIAGLAKCGFVPERVRTYGITSRGKEMLVG